MSEAALLPIVLVAIVVLAFGLGVVRRTDAIRRSAGRKPLGGSGPWVIPVVIAVVIVGWAAASWFNR